MSDIRVRIYGEFNDKGFKKAGKATSGLEKQFNKLGKAIGGIFAAQQIVAFGKASLKAFNEDEKAARRLTTALKNLGLGFEDPRIQAYIANLEKTSGILDDELRPAFQSLLTTTGSVTQAQKLLATAIDVAAGSGVDLTTVAQDLSAAYIGNTKGLRKYNLGLTQAELKGMAFSEVQDKLNKQFSGQNAAYLETYAGKMAALNVAFANAQETIGKGLADAFIAIAGNNGIGAATQAMEDFSQKISDAILGMGTLIGKINSLPKIGGRSLTDILFASAGGGFIDALAKYGEQQRTAPKPQMNRAMSVAGASDLYTRQDAARKKAEQDAIKRAKALAALQKKAALDQIKREREAAALKRAGTVFDMENIQIVAAMQGKIDGEQRLRLVALLAIHNEMAEVAEKTASAVLALNAPALASLGVIIKSGDNVTDVLNKLAIAQAKTALVALGITDLPKAKNPFEDWFDVIDRVLAGLANVKNAVNSIGKAATTTVSAGTTTTVIGGGTGGGGTTGGPNPSISSLGKRVGDTLDAIDSIVFGNGGMTTTTVGPNPAITDLGKRVGDTLDAIDAGMFGVLSSGSAVGPNPAVSNLGKRTGDFGDFGGSTTTAPITVNVTVQGSVTSETDLTSTILDNLYKYQQQGVDLRVSSVAI